MKRFFRNIPWRNVLIITLVAVLGIGAIAGISSIAKEEKKTISSAAFSRGAIDNNGFYVESKTSLYTKDLIECQGLEIEPDFEAAGHYQVFYYDTNKNFLGATEYFDTQSYGVYTKGTEFGIAKYCRIMITPETPEDDYGNTIEDYEIKFYEVSSIASKYKISVDKDQKLKFENYFVVDENMIDKVYRRDGEGSYEISAESTRQGFGCCEFISVADMKEITIYADSKNREGIWNYFFVDKDDQVIGYGDNQGALEDIVLEVPTGAVEFVCSFKLDNTFVINQTK